VERFPALGLDPRQRLRCALVRRRRCSECRRQQPRGRHAVRYRTTAASPLSPVGRGLLCNVGSMGGKGWRKTARPRCCVTVTGKHGKQKQTVTSTRPRRQEEGGAEAEAERQRQRGRGRGRGRGAQSWLPAGRSPAVVLRHSLGNPIIISPSLSTHSHLDCATRPPRRGR
jgi:hypothetical protein